MKRIFFSIFPVLIALAIAGCASTVNRNTSNIKETSNVKEETVQITKFLPLKSLTVTLDANAQDKLKDNENFSKDRLYNKINSTLLENQYLQTQNNNSNSKIDVVITNIRVRSGVSAILLGFLAGADSITGQIYVKNGDKVIDNFEVDITYAFGGAMGDTDTRMNWMYESFATKIVEELKKLVPKT
jgi:uncharacterized protein (UPF0210 family)